MVPRITEWRLPSVHFFPVPPPNRAAFGFPSTPPSRRARPLLLLARVHRLVLVDVAQLLLKGNHRQIWSRLLRLPLLVLKQLYAQHSIEHVHSRLAVRPVVPRPRPQRAAWQGGCDDDTDGSRGHGGHARVVRAPAACA